MAKETHYCLGEEIPIDRFIGFFKFRFLEFQNEFVKEIESKHNIDLNLKEINNYLVDEVARLPIDKLFLEGFCLHFAKILETAYPGGWICFINSLSHIVYVYENHVYDINGDRTEEFVKAAENGSRKEFIFVDLMPEELKTYIHNREPRKRTKKELANKLRTLGEIADHKLIWSIKDVTERLDSKHRDEINKQIKAFFKY